MFITPIATADVLLRSMRWFNTIIIINIYSSCMHMYDVANTVSVHVHMS